MFAYSAIYFARLQSTMLATYVLYFGYMSLLCLGLSALTGCIGFYSCLWFTRKIYSSIKVRFRDPQEGRLVYDAVVAVSQWSRRLITDGSQRAFSASQSSRLRT